MTYVRRFKTMYQHTLDGSPAAFDEHPDYVHFVGGRNKVRLVPTLRQLRREQQRAIAECWKEVARGNEAQRDWARRSRYGYVLVEVPL